MFDPSKKIAVVTKPKGSAGITLWVPWISKLIQNQKNSLFLLDHDEEDEGFNNPILDVLEDVKKILDYKDLETFDIVLIADTAEQISEYQIEGIEPGRIACFFAYGNREAILKQAECIKKYKLAYTLSDFLPSEISNLVGLDHFNLILEKSYYTPHFINSCKNQRGEGSINNLIYLHDGIENHNNKYIDKIFLDISMEYDDVLSFDIRDIKLNQLSNRLIRCKKVIINISSPPFVHYIYDFCKIHEIAIVNLSRGSNLAIERAIISKNKILLQNFFKQNEVKSVKKLVIDIFSETKKSQTLDLDISTLERKETWIALLNATTESSRLSMFSKNQIKVFEENPKGLRKNKQNPFSVIEKAGDLTSLNIVSRLLVNFEDEELDQSIYKSILDNWIENILSIYVKENNSEHLINFFILISKKFKNEFFEKIVNRLSGSIDHRTRVRLIRLLCFSFFSQGTEIEYSNKNYNFKKCNLENEILIFIFLYSSDLELEHNQLIELFNKSDRNRFFIFFEYILINSIQKNSKMIEFFKNNYEFLSNNYDRRLTVDIQIINLIYNSEKEAFFTDRILDFLSEKNINFLYKISLHCIANNQKEQFNQVVKVAFTKDYLSLSYLEKVILFYFYLVSGEGDLDFSIFYSLRNSSHQLCTTELHPYFYITIFYFFSLACNLPEMGTKINNIKLKYGESKIEIPDFIEEHINAKNIPLGLVESVLNENLEIMNKYF